MLAVEVDFLASRFGATAFNDRGAAEWPPHPARLFSAMVGAWADSPEPSPEEEAALRWFELLPPPAITCARESEIFHRAIVTHYVPVNDARVTTRDVGVLYQRLRLAQLDLETAEGDRATAKASKALARAVVNVRRDAQAAGAASGEISAAALNTALSVLPELRGRQGRTFPTVRLSERASAVHYSWADPEPAPEAKAALDRVLARVGRLGHSSTPVSCRVVTSERPSDVRSTEGPAPEGMVVWREVREAGGPRHQDEDPVLVRVPAPGLFDRLVSQFAADEGSRPRVAPARFVPYRAVNGSEVPPPLSSMLAGSWRVLAIRRGGRVRLTRTLDLTRAVRGALLSGSGDSPSYVLHGHAPGQPGTATPPGLQPHLSILPLANVGSYFSDGSVHGVALVLPRGASAEDRHAVDDAVQRWKDRGRAGSLPLWIGGLAAELDDLGSDFSASGDRVKATVLTRGFWSRPSRQWASITPIALDRYPGRLNEAGWEERAAATIATACLHLDLPGPAEVEIVWGPPLAGVPAAGPRGLSRQPGARFPGFRAGTSDQLRLCVHARLSFSEAIRGPLVVGAGRFAGYGLCLPTAAEGEWD